MSLRKLAARLVQIALLVCLGLNAFGQEEFVGPFSSWKNAKTGCGAAGNGSTDDTSALQGCINGLNGSYDVVYLPAGIYKISSALTVTSKQHVSFIGADPGTVTLKASGSFRMLVLDGTTMARVGRVTFDGSSSASVGLAVDQTSGSFAATDIGVEDCVFKNLTKGIQGSHFGGANDSEVSVYRCKFQSTTYGVSVESFNALDYWIWDSTFTNNQDAVTNTNGAGDFHIYRCLFQNSSDSDIKTSHTQAFGFRGNTSSGSNRFYTSDQEYTNGGPMMFQGNKILDTTQADAIQIGSVGQVSFVDNIIRSRSGVTAAPINIFNNSGPDVITVGNTYTAASLLDLSSATSPKTWSQDDQATSYSSVNGSLPSMPGTLPNNNRAIVEISPGSSASTIQSAINAAVAGTRTVLHFAPGSYNLSSTVTTPAFSDIQFVGDGYGSDLNWSGSGGGTMFSLSAPSKVTFRELRFDSSNAQSILVNSSDQSGSRVHGEGIFMEHINGNCVLAESLVNTAIDFTGLESNHQTNAPCIQAVGSGGGGTSYIAQFGGLIGADAVIDGPHYQVTNGGRILEEDIWFEGPDGRLIYPSDSGTFTFNIGHLSPQSGAPVEDLTQVTGFHGNITFLGTEHDFSNDGTNSRQALHVVSRASDTNILYAGQSCCQYNQNVAGGGPSYISIGGSGGTITAMNNKELGEDGVFQIANAGTAATAAFVRTMLAPLRTTLPTADPVPNTAAGATDVRLYRLNFANSTKAIHVVATAGGTLVCAINSTSPLADATVSISYSLTLAQTGCSGNWSASSGLPPGLSLSTGGALSGTPTTAGAYSFTASVGSASKALAMTVKPNTSFPAVISTPQSLFQAADHSHTTLAADLSSSGTTISVSDGTSFVADQVIRIDNEQIEICAEAAATLTACSGGRGIAGTTAASHSNTTTVDGRITAIYGNTLNARLIELETWAAQHHLGNYGCPTGPSGFTSGSSWPCKVVTLDDLGSDVDGQPLTVTTHNRRALELASFESDIFGTTGSTLGHTGTCSGCPAQPNSSWPNHPVTTTELLVATPGSTVSKEFHNRTASEILGFETDVKNNP